MKIKQDRQDDYDKYVKPNSGDAYSSRVVSYTNEWAKLMETALERGETIAQCASSTSHEADTDGITGFMYGAAVSGLARFWEHGEELRRWHNIDTQIGDEGEKANASGGTLNPALLSIQTKD